VQRGSARGLMSLRRVTELIYSVFECSQCGAITRWRREHTWVEDC
jgi:hypothetical protein